MEFKVVYTKAFNGFLRSLQQQGNKRVVQAVRAAISEAGMNGEISVPRTKHGESRLPNVEKYDLPDAFRLVVQLVDGSEKTRAFLFVGSHADAERWLDNHRNYRWVKSKTDGMLDFVQVTETKEQRYVPADRVDLESPEELLSLPLLRVLSPDEWTALALPDRAASFCSAICGNDYERDAEGILTRLDELVGWEKAGLVIDLLAHAHAGEWAEVHRRVGLVAGEATVAAAPEIASAMLSIDNSESFVVFDDPHDLDAFFAEHSLADWMLFLHPEQRKVAEREFKGPARLRGVSGSGKTSVLIHRARFLAKKYREPVLLVTLTESMRKLLELLADDLCGVERDQIKTMTVSALARQVVDELHPRRSNFYSIIGDDRQDRIIVDIATRVRAHSEIERTPFIAMSDAALREFLRDEILYTRSRLRDSEIDQYLDPQAFRRHGRGVPLNEVSRGIVLDGLVYYRDQLIAGSLLDHEGIVGHAIELLENSGKQFRHFRGILCDEVQDLSQLEIALIGGLSTPAGEHMSNAENGLFLAGDGAQTIYKRGFTLKSLGIDISGRSYCLRKNYRNTHEILRAAFGLVAQYEFADVDEDNIVRPSEPEFAKRHGARPLILRCASVTDEAEAVATSIRSLVEMGHPAGQICVVGPSVRTRDEVQQALSQRGVRFTDLRQNVDYEADVVKVSTIESAKGHEFAAVFIMGLVEGVLPVAGTPDAEIPRQAARFYVAMTRARERLTITYSPWSGYPASRFLAAIQADCDEGIYRDGRIVRLTQ